MKELTKRSLLSHAKALDAREYSAEELVRGYLDNIYQRDGEINSYVTVATERAIARAKESDRRRAAGQTLGALDGIPFAVKDNISVGGLPLTCASRILSGYVSPYDATAVALLEKSGAVLLGKTNLDEFAMGTGSESSCFGRVKNPLAPSRVAGGSSGGSAAAVCAELACFALGSDTGGSVRQPAAFCGVYGLRPTYSSISRYGLVGFAPSLDTVGIISREIRDCACVFNVVAHEDPMDATSKRRPDGDPYPLFDHSPCIRNMRIAIVSESLSGISDEVADALWSLAKALEGLGAKLSKTSLPSLNSAYAAYYTLSSAEASSNLSRFDGVRYGRRAENAKELETLYRKSRSEGFGDEVKRRILFGALALSQGFRDEIYAKAVAARARITAELEAALAEFDALLLPTSSTVAYSAGERKDSLFDAYATDDLLCAPASLSGLPALSLPVATRAGLPCGMQLVGRRYCENSLFEIADALGSLR